MRALLREVLREVKVSVDQAAEKAPPPYDSQANGDVENAIKQVQGLLRTVKSCLEARLGRSVPTNHAVMWRMVRHVAWLLHVRLRCRDGQTSYDRARGREFSKRLAAFGEICLYKFVKEREFDGYDEHGKLAERWGKGAFLGYDRLSNEYIFHSQGRIVKSRALQRVSADQRWSAAAVQEVSLTPHDKHVKPGPGVVFGEQAAQQPERKENAKLKAVRDLKLFRRDFEKYGFTETGCDQCKWALGYGWEATTSLSHSRECRHRIKEAIRASGPEGVKRVEAAELRADRWTAWDGEPAAQGQGEMPRGVVAERPG